ncbi:hypothetical protein CVT26_007047 [Gymnopilus dilepis]|uniref:Uncharacterized protein n=1 Tax=Gymnopilus dilepis TaxID=231916 RepID=A0A409VZZ0_9AGAR|nr:hypothetical protein CVT26_007047 [Gymnopilus dilepis]
MPDEILTEIFLFTTVPSNGEPDPFNAELASKIPIHSLQVMGSPFPLSQVCRLWRAIVLGTKAMWRSIAIYGPNTSHLRRVELWMERVRDHNLDVGLYIYDGPRLLTTNHEAIEAVVELLCRRITTWQTLELHTGKYVTDILVNRLKESVTSSALRKVTLKTKMAGPRADFIWKFLHDIRSLETLVWKGPHIYQATAVPTNTRIRALELASFDGPERQDFVIPSFFADTLSAYPNLEELRIEVRFPWNMISAIKNHAFNPIVLPKVRRLTLNVGSCLSHLSKQLSAPALHTLDVTTTSDDSKNVEQFLSRSGCTLKQLTVRSTRFDKWFELDAIQSVEALNLYERADFNLDDLVRFLSCPPAAGKRMGSLQHYFPNLRSLTIVGHNRTRSFDAKALLLMLDRRFGMVPLGLEPKAKLSKAVISVPEMTDVLPSYKQTINDKPNLQLTFTVSG